MWARSAGRPARGAARSRTERPDHGATRPRDVPSFSNDRIWNEERPPAKRARVCLKCEQVHKSLNGSPTTRYETNRVLRVWMCEVLMPQCTCVCVCCGCVVVRPVGCVWVCVLSAGVSVCACVVGYVVACVCVCVVWCVALVDNAMCCVCVLL